MLRRIKYNIGNIIFVVLFSFTGITFNSCISIQVIRTEGINATPNIGDDVLDKIPLAIEASSNEFKNIFEECDSLFLTSMLDKTIILAGELHYFENNYKLKLEFVKYLHEKQNINDIIIEYPISNERLYDKYLNHTNKRLITNMKYLSLDSINERKFILGLDEYNNSLPYLEKVKIHCVDVEKNPLFAFETLYHIFPEINIPVQLKKAHDILATTNERTKIKPRKDRSLIKFLIEDFNRNKTIYKSHLSENATTYASILEGLRIGLLSDNETSNFLIERENFIYKNIVALVNANKDKSYYLHLGLAHCSLLENDTLFSNFKFSSVGYKLQNNFDSPVKNKVLSVMQFYTNYDDVKYQNYFLDSAKATIISRSQHQISLFYKSEINNDSGYLKRFNLLLINKNNLNQGSY